MRVLIVERATFMLRTFADALQQRGHEVVLASHVKSLQPITIETPDGKEEQLQGTFHLALVDGLMNEVCTGPNIVKALTEQGTACLAISCDDNENERLLAAGAVCAARKADALSALYFAEVTVQELLLPRAASLGNTFKQAAKAVKNDPKRKEEISAVVDAALKKAN
jgi:CheY-like chemotaxis protein